MCARRGRRRSGRWAPRVKREALDDVASAADALAELGIEGSRWNARVEAMIEADLGHEAAARGNDSIGGLELHVECRERGGVVDVSGSCEDSTRSFAQQGRTAGHGEKSENAIEAVVHYV